MNVEVKYNIGDEIAWKYAQNSSRQETCSFCGGSKEVQGADHTILPCPKCKGTGKTPVPEYREGRSIIRSISIAYDSEYNTEPVVTYRTDSGNISQKDVTGKVEGTIPLS